MPSARRPGLRDLRPMRLSRPPRGVDSHHGRHAADGYRGGGEHRCGGKSLGDDRGARGLARDARGRAPARPGRAPARPSGTTRAESATAGATADGRFDRPREHDRGRRRRQHRDDRAHLHLARLDRGGERRARRAVTQVGAHAAPAENPAVAVGDRLADLSARHLASLGALGDPTPGFEDGLLGGARRDIERNRDLLVGKPAQLPHHERAARPLGQRRQVPKEGLQTGAIAGLVLCRARHRERRVAQWLLAAPAPAQHRDRLVVRDPEQPWAERGAPLSAL